MAPSTVEIPVLLIVTLVSETILGILVLFVFISY